MSDDLLVDKRLIRRSFEHAAATYDQAAVLQNEVCRRMLSRLDYIRLQPAAILDAGSGTGNALETLCRRWPGARVIALDIALGMLQRGRRRLPWWKQLLLRGAARIDFACGDLECLPLSAASADLVWSNLALQWLNHPAQGFAEVHRVLAPGGLFMFSTFGPDTLKELRRAYQGTDRRTHVNRFVDMHDVGDMLVARGFADPVMDMEYITLTYREVTELMRDLKAIGAHNLTQGRPQGLSGKALLAAVTRNYERFRRDGVLPATFEIVYGHAWKPEPRKTAGGRRIIELKVKRDGA